MRATLAVLLIVAAVTVGIAFGGAQLIEDQAQPQPARPQPTTSGDPPPPPEDGYLKQDNGTVRPTMTLEDYDWQRVQIRATILGVHFNINQPAKSYDSSADTWSRVFTVGIPFKQGDYVAFCGPQSSITIDVRDTESLQIIHTGTITGVPSC